ncbi:MAG: tetratricopeptide repeat protein [Thermodesulfobacteriota bacterium]|nr:tetratricopeptide repeat protein [Thermodesulfobacteriota bacterium]
MDETIDKAIRVCVNKLKVNPQDWNARAFLGRCYLKKGMMQEARKELEEAVRVVSNNKVIFKLLADIYENEGRTKEAKWIYRIYLSMDIEDSKTDSSLHSIKTDDPIKKEAKSDIKRKKPIKKEEKSKQETPESVIKEKQQAKKEEKLKEKKRISTTTIADIYLKQGYMDKALSIYREILAKDPTNTEVQEKINSITHKKEEVYIPPIKIESLDDLELSLHSIKTDDPIKKEAKSDIKRKKPIKKEEKSKQETPESIIKEKQQAKKEAEEEEKSKAKKRISTPAIADIYLKQGYTDKALSIYREILAKDPTNTEVQEKINSITHKKEEAYAPSRKAKSLDDLKKEMVIATLNKWLDNLLRLKGRSI